MNVLAILNIVNLMACTSLSSDFLIYAAPVIADAYAQLFTAILRHGYVPASLRDCLIVPIRKGQKDPSISDNYRQELMSAAKERQTTVHCLSHPLSNLAP